MNLTTVDPRRVLASLSALCFAVLVGFALATSPVLAVGGIVGAALVAMTVTRPEFGALAILVLVAIVPRDVLFDQGIALGGGNLKVTDLLLVVTVGSWLAARTVNPVRYPLPSLPTTLLLLGFLLLALVSLATADAMGTPRKLSLLELRPLLSYLLVFPLVSAARSWAQLRLGIAMLLGAAALSAGISIVQYALGVGSDATFTGGALRVDSATFLFPMIAAVWALALLAHAPTRRARWVTLCLAAVSITGLFFTFSRGAWLALIAGGLMVLVLLRPRRRVRALGWLVPLGVIAAASVVAFNSMSTRQVANPLSAGLDRLTSVGEYRNDVSSRYRVGEWETAVDEITRHPLTGIGLGTSITFTNPMFSSSSNSYGYSFSTFYIHNSYLWFALKIGVVGAFVFFALIVRVAWMALAGLWRTRHPHEELVFLACLGSLFAILVLSVTGPHLNVDSATPVVAALIAGVEIARRLASRGRRGGIRLKITLFDWTVGGHHPLYVRRFVEALRPAVDVVVAAPDETLTQIRDLEIECVSLGTARPLLDMNRPLPPQHRELAERELDLFADVAHQTCSDHIVHLYADPVIRRLVRRPVLPTPTTLCVFFPRAHYPRIYKTPLRPRELLRARFLEHLVSRWRRRSDAHALFTLDAEAVRGWAARKGARPYWFPEPPIAPFTVDLNNQRNGCVLYGTLAGRKGLDLVAAAVALGQSDLKIVLGGDVEPDFREPLKLHMAAMQEAGATVELRAHRHTEGEGLQLLASARCVLLPYQNHYTGSRVLLEAATVGTPVIAHRDGLLGDLVRRHQLGLAVDCTDPEAFRRALLSMTEADRTAAYREALGLWAARYTFGRFQQAVRAPFVRADRTSRARRPPPHRLGSFPMRNWRMSS